MWAKEFESPNGFRERKLFGTGGRILMPADWVYHHMMEKDHFVFELSRENGFPDGYFISGMRLDVIQKFPTKASPLDTFVREYLKKSPDNAEPESELEFYVDNTLTVAKRTFFTREEQDILIPIHEDEVIKRHMDPTHFRYVVVGNKSTGTLYVAKFETPTDKWDTDKKIANVMFDGFEIDLSC